MIALHLGRCVEIVTLCRAVALWVTLIPSARKVVRCSPVKLLMFTAIWCHEDMQSIQCV